MKQNPTKYQGKELEYIKKVLNSENWSSTAGNWNQVLEQEMCRIFGTKYAVAFNSGTSTLHAALEACGVQEGDEVISPALTVIMNTTATIHANAIPVYADINPDTFTVDPEDIERKITPKTKAIMAVSIYGLPCDMDPINELAKKYNLAVIEDNAQCFLSKYKDKKTGTIGDIASYSFENTKHISCGEGGIIITDNEHLAMMCRKIGGHGFKNLKAEEGRVRLRQETFQNPNYKRHDVLGWNYRLSEFNAAIALAQLEKHEHLVDLRVESAKIFLEEMAEVPYLVPQVTPHGYENSYYTLGVKYEGDELIGVPWQEFRKKYIEFGGDGVYGAWSIPYLEPLVVNNQYAYRNQAQYKDLSYPVGLCPVAERVQPKIMQFKTNYRDLELAKQKALALREAIRYYK
tara:strand:- start:5966 stop:7174 length:1209 start_codon:yes stop_codon:yes gene_type:complete